MKHGYLKTIVGMLALAATQLAPGQARAFCFSNDSLSNTKMEVQQLDKNEFFQSLSAGLDKACKGVSSGEAKSCKEMASGMAEGLKAAAADLKAKKVIGPAIQTVENAAEIAYDKITGLPIAGDAVNLGKSFTHQVGKGIGQGAKVIGGLIDKLTSKRFRKTIEPDGMECCNHSNRDCNPSGDKNAKIYFNVKYKGSSRVVGIGATDHLECRVTKNNPSQTACHKYVFPEEPFRAHKETARGMLIKSMLNGKCLDVSGFDKKNGANVAMWDCHGDLNQRWRYGQNGMIYVRDPGKPQYCLEIGGWKKEKGANVNVWECQGKNANQGWQAVKK